MHIPDEIASIAGWKYLRKLDMGIPEFTPAHFAYDLDSQVRLLELYHSLKSRGVIVKLTTEW